MPQYTYRAIDKSSQISNGILVAENESVLEHRMEALGLWLIEAQETEIRRQARQKVKVTRKQLVDFFSGLATLVDAGVDIAESLRVIVNETDHEGLRNVLEDVRLNIESGVSFFDAMSAHPEVFSVEVCNLVRAGEHSGELVAACADIGDHLEWVDQLMSDIKQATMYPTMIACAVMGLVFIMFSFVVPQFSLIFDSLDMELPGITRAVVAVGEFCSNYWWAILICIGAIIGFLRVAPERIEGFAFAIDRFKLSLPVFGSLNQMLVLSQFAHNMALMLKAGVPIIEAIGLVRGVVGNRVLQDALEHAEKMVTDGHKISDALADHQVVSPIVMRMIVVGEETGRLDSCLEKISQRMDDEIPRRIKRVFGILEPLIIVCLLGIVGVVAAAIFMPLFSMMSGIRG